MITTDGTYHFDPHVARQGRRDGDLPQRKWEPLCHGLPPRQRSTQLVPDGAASWDSGLLSEAGATFEHLSETEGVYHYYCTPHETVGMIGSIIVGEPDAHGQPALEEPPQDMPTVSVRRLRNSTRCVTARSGTEH